MSELWGYRFIAGELCKCYGLKYVIEARKIIMNQLDMRKVERSEKVRNNFPEKVLGTLGPYPEERIIFEQDWKLKNHFLVTNEKARALPPGTDYSALETAIDNAYNLWLTKKRNKQS